MEWVRGDVIGYGSFSTVNLAMNKNYSPKFPQIMAVKSASLSRSDMLLREKSILEELRDCPQIIQCFGGDQSIKNCEKSFNLFLEYAAGGTLADKMKKQSDRKLPEYLVRRYTKSILEGVKYIHERGFVHCDLKLENILLCQSSKESIKIADFGLARRGGERKGEREGAELRGTPLYMSPETVVGGSQEAAADIWAVGCMVAEMVAGAPAWRCHQDTGVLRLLTRIGVGDEVPEIPEEMSPDGRDFLEKIFVKNPEQRWTAQMLLDHPFLVGQFCEEDSPRGPFDWIDEYETTTQSSCSVSEMKFSDFNSDMFERLRRLVTCQGPDWAVTESWVAVR